MPKLQSGKVQKIHSDKVHGKRHGLSDRAKVWIILAVTLVLVAVLTYSTIQPNVQEVMYTKTMLLQTNKTAYFRIFNSAAIALTIQSMSNSSATFYISEVPLLYGPIDVVSLAVGSSANVSSGGLQFADMNVKLVSIGSGGATVSITPVLSGLGIRVSRVVSVLNPAALYTLGVGSNAIAVVRTSTTSTTSTALAQNTVALQEQQAMAIVNQSSIGILMKNYKSLYNKGVRCNATVYNSTYQIRYSTLPTGPFSFENVSSFTPTDLTSSIAQLTAPHNFAITYSTVSPSPQSTGPAVRLTVNTSSYAPISNVIFTGVFQGDNYTRLNSMYTSQSQITNFCAVYVP